MHFYVLVEGATERDALKPWLARWLNPRLSKPVGVKVIKHSGWHEFWKDVPGRAGRLLNGPGSEDIIGVIALLDLYGAGMFPQHISEVSAKTQWGRDDMARRFAHPRFSLHFAVHETEAWLLSSPAIFPREIRSQIEAISARPETVNTSHPPAYRLDKIYESALGRGYKQTVDGKNLFAALDPEVAAGKCPRLLELLNTMLGMAVAAGIPLR